jgi:hypothetical protein
MFPSVACELCPARWSGCAFTGNLKKSVEGVTETKFGAESLYATIHLLKTIPDSSP